MREQLIALLREVISFGVSVEPRTAQLTLVEALSALSDTLDGTARLHLLLDKAHDYPDVPDALQQLAQWLTRQEGHDLKLARALFLLSYRHMQARRCGGLNRRGIGRSNRAESIERLPLDEVYVIPNLRTEKDVARDDEGDALRLLDDDYVSEEKRSEALKRFEEHKGERWRRERQQETFVLGKALQRARHTVILGGPGSGKSTLIRYVTRACALGGDAMRERLGWEEERTPVSVPVSLFAEALQSNAKLTVERFLLDTLREDGGEPLAAVVADELKAGRVVVLLDGLDEVPEASLRHQVAEAIRDFLREFSSARVIMTSRPYGYARILPATTPGDLPHYELLPFTPEQVEEFLRDWHTVLDKSQPLATDIREQKRNVEAVLQEIRAKESTQELASNPLLLVILTIICWEDNHLPEQRVVLYKRIVELLAGQWNELRKQVPGVAKGDDGLTEQSLIRALGYIAAYMRAGHRFLKREALEKQFVIALEDMGEPRPEQLARTYLESAARRAGILEEFGHDHFTFWHPTFEEYLTAYHFTRRGFDTKAELLKVRHNPRYKEVILLTLGYIAQIEADKTTANNLVRSLWKDNPDAWEEYLHRNLLVAVDCVVDKSCVRPELAVDILMELSEIVKKYPISLFINALEEFSKALPTIGTVDKDIFNFLLPIRSVSKTVSGSIYRFIFHATEVNSECDRLWNDIKEKFDAIEEGKKVRQLIKINNLGEKKQNEFVVGKLNELSNSKSEGICLFALDAIIKFGSKNHHKMCMKRLKELICSEIPYIHNRSLRMIVKYGSSNDLQDVVKISLDLLLHDNYDLNAFAVVNLLEYANYDLKKMLFDKYKKSDDGKDCVIQEKLAQYFIENGNGDDKKYCLLIYKKLIRDNVYFDSIYHIMQLIRYSKSEEVKKYVDWLIDRLKNSEEHFVLECIKNVFIFGDLDQKNIAMEKLYDLLRSERDIGFNSKLNLLTEFKKEFGNKRSVNMLLELSDTVIEFDIRGIGGFILENGDSDQIKKFIGRLKDIYPDAYLFHKYEAIEIIMNHGDEEDINDVFEDFLNFFECDDSDILGMVSRWLTDIATVKQRKKAMQKIYQMLDSDNELFIYNASRFIDRKGNKSDINMLIEKLYNYLKQGGKSNRYYYLSILIKYDFEKYENEIINGLNEILMDNTDYGRFSAAEFFLRKRIKGFYYESLGVLSEKINDRSAMFYSSEVNAILDCADAEFVKELFDSLDIFGKCNILSCIYSYMENNSGSYPSSMVNFLPSAE